MSAPDQMGLRGVILCADDFAVHESASRGIAALAALGRLSATSAMVLSPRWPQDVALLQEVRGHIDVGLHLDWTSDFAIAAGHGKSLRAAMLKAALGGFDRTAARGVIERQLDAFEAQWMAPPDFVDGHQHVQQFAGIREALVQALASRYGGKSDHTPYVRISRAPAASADLKSRVIAAMGASALETIATKAGITGAAALLGIYDFSGDGARYASLMAGWLHAAPARSIIMCHPALADEVGDAIGAARAREFAYLGSADFPQALAHAGVQLVRGVSQ
ncbi:MAG: ChbG/HpnK family deacetylase [Rhodoferax sp.]|uniref:ChbG/HpnK family deacetylase n=1 Tax=Rhodoferax sp. TaxID=50421 RepID=UPI00271812F0|nr:ChbG/HpnK family deacetylase [Rhodoferax sp.]MDO8449373.1 ChbG/HpnK family deacetylase [Rhodoferax sp.]